MQRTLKRELKVPEIVEGEPVVTLVLGDRITAPLVRLGCRWVPTGTHHGGRTKLVGQALRFRASIIPACWDC